MFPSTIGSSARWTGIAALAVATSSCTASLDLDRFRTSEDAITESVSSITYFDVQFKARSMMSHIGEYMEVRILDRDNRLQAKVIYNDVSHPDFTLYMSRIVPKTNAPYRLDWWADHNITAKYDGIEGGINEKDHAWRRVLSDPLPEDMRLVGGRYELDFLHDTVFVDIATDLQGNKVELKDTLLPLNLKITGANAYIDKMIEARVVESASGRLVGMHRQGRAKESYTASVTGILDEVTPYEISVYVDADTNGKYSPGDPSWKVAMASDGAGIASELNLATATQSPIETGEPQ